mgnify:CR=1 FL=1
MKSRSWAMLFAGLIAALLLLWKLLPGSGGNTVGVYQDGDLVKTIYLPHTGETETFELSGVAGGNTIEVSKDGVRVVSAGCPDQVCVLHGPLRRTGGPIVCLPNRLSIEWATGADVDALSGTGGLS